MSHRAEDHYSYVATQDISSGTVFAFRKGDPIPESTVEENGWADTDPPMAVTRNEWDDKPEGEPERPMTRGEMPAHLKAKASEKSEDKATTDNKPATRKAGSKAES